jgi:hypothetical protein
LSPEAKSIILRPPPKPDFNKNRNFSQNFPHQD